MKKHKITEQDYLKAHRRASREEEIALYGKPVRLRAVHKSKKAYDRKREKAGFSDLPFSFLLRNVLPHPSCSPGAIAGTCVYGRNDALQEFRVTNIDRMHPQNG